MEAPQVQWLWPRRQGRNKEKRPGRPQDPPGLENFWAGRNPPHAAKVNSGVREPEFAGGTPSPHKTARGKEAPFLFCLNRKKASATTKGGCDVRVEAVAEDNSDDDKGTSAVVHPNREKAFTTAKGRRDDDSDNNKGASVVIRPDHEKAFAAAKGGCDNDLDDNKSASVIVRPNAREGVHRCQGQARQ
jgi:hypothetical protein